MISNQRMREHVYPPALTQLCKFEMCDARRVTPGWLKMAGKIAVPTGLYRAHLIYRFMMHINGILIPV